MRKGEAERHRVHAELVEPRVVGDQRGDVGRADVGTHGPGDFLMHGARAHVALPLHVIDLHAVVGAAGAGRDAAVEGLPVGLGVVVDLLERGVLEVVHIERSVDPVIVDPDGEARPLLLPVRQNVVGNGGRELGADALAGGLVREWRRLAALEHDRLQLLRAHHGTHPHARGGVGAAAHDAGEAHPVLAGRPDRGDLGIAAEAALQLVPCLAGGQPPLWRRVEERHRASVDQEAGRTVCDTVKDEGVVASALERDAPRPLDTGLAHAAGERRLGADHMAHHPRQRVAADDAVGEDQQVLRPQRVDAGGRALQKQSGGEHAGAAGDPVLQLRRLLDPARLAAEVNVQ